MIGSKKELSFELDLLPLISVLAICICFLLVTAIWELVGSVELKQATGSTPMLTDTTPILVVSLYNEKVELQLKNGRTNQLVAYPTSSPELASKVRGSLDKGIDQIKVVEKSPITNAIVLAGKSTSYQQIVSMLEMLKLKGFSQVGLSSL